MSSAKTGLVGRGSVIIRKSRKMLLRILSYFNVSDGLGRYLGVRELARDHISYHANAQLMGIDPDRLYEGCIFYVFDHLPT